MFNTGIHYNRMNYHLDIIFGFPFKTFELSGYTAIIIIHNRHLKVLESYFSFYF